MIEQSPDKIEIYLLRFSDYIRRVMRIDPPGKLVKMFKILGLFFVFVLPILIIAVVIIAFGVSTIQEYNYGIYWDSLFCGPQKISKVTRSVVRIENKDSSGSGFWIADDLILTNNHVINFQEDTLVVDRGHEYHPQVVQTDTLMDLAILRIKNPEKHETLAWRARWPILAEEVYTLGFPEGASEINITKGIISSLTSDKFDSTKYIQTDAAINPGNSGGPLVDICGKALGITSSTLLDAQNIGFAINASHIQKELAQMINASKNITEEEIQKGQTGPETEIIAKYYTTLSKGDFENAYNFYSQDLKERKPFKTWKDSYKNTFIIRLKLLKKISSGMVRISFMSIDFPNKDEEDFVIKEFQGIWTLAKEDDLWKLNRSEIEEIPLEKIIINFLQIYGTIRINAAGASDGARI